MRNQVRIIAGQWRGRKISFPEKLSLRPTPDRVKETLFNWLAPFIVGARCLELFAGSAALSFESLSRHARMAIAIEMDMETVAAIKKNAEILQTTKLQDSAFQVIQENCMVWLKSTMPSEPFDIIFIDPPYADNAIIDCLHLLNMPGWLSEKAWVYFETDDPKIKDQLPIGWNIVKEKQAGQVYFYLISRK